MTGPVAGNAPTGPGRRRSYRWIRVAVPFLVLAALWTVTLVARSMQTPDLRDPGTLSPIGEGPDGSSRLAQLLASRGVPVDRVTSSQAALQAASAADATVFLPTPDFLQPTLLRLLSHADGRHRVVVLQPGLRTLLSSPAPMFPTYTRWATASVPPRCDAPFATAAGRAAAHQTTYATADPPSLDCYSGGVVGVRGPSIEIIYVGASDPFRNSRLDESGNAPLAAGLLAEYGRLVWVDVHAPEPVSLSPGDLPTLSLPQYHRGEQDRGGTGNPMIDAFPPTLWAVVLLALAATALLAVARARRLGPPVAEPLPVLVPAAETVTGRGRLYDRVGARAATFATLRDAAVTRIARALNPYGRPQQDLLGRDPGPSPAAEALLAQVAQRTGATPAQVRAVLYGAEPAGDEALARAVADLDALVHAVLHNAPQPPTRPPGRQPGPPPGRP